MRRRLITVNERMFFAGISIFMLNAGLVSAQDYCNIGTQKAAMATPSPEPLLKVLVR